MGLITKLLSHWFTARDGESYSMTKLGFTTGVSAMTYRFVTDVTTPSYEAYAMGVAALIAAMAAKYYVEGGK